jgi:hypothetical protein
MNMTTAKIQIVKLSGKQEPIVRRRAQCVARLNDQAALLADPSYQRVLVRWSGKGVNRKSTEKKLPERSWAKQQLNGVEFRLRFLPDGQGIVVGSMAELPGAIEQLVEQIKGGELDALITPVKKEKKTAPKLRVVGRRDGSGGGPARPAKKAKTA